MGPLSKRTGVLLREETQTEHHMRTELRDWSDAATSQRTPRIAGQHQELGRGKEVFYLESQRKHHPADTFISDFQAPEL